MWKDGIPQNQAKAMLRNRKAAKIAANAAVTTTAIAHDEPNFRTRAVVPDLKSEALDPNTPEGKIS